MTSTARHTPGLPLTPWRRASYGVVLLLLAAHLVGSGSLWRGNVAAPVPPERLQLRIDPNRASLVELQLLPRIGPTLAQNIIAYRDAVQQPPAFRTPEDLDRVPRIGPATIEALRPYLTFPEPDTAPREPTVP